MRRWASIGSTITVGSATIGGRTTGATRTSPATWRGRVTFSRGCWRCIVCVGIRIDSGCSVLSVLHKRTGIVSDNKVTDSATHHDGSTKGIVGLCLHMHGR